MFWSLWLLVVIAGLALYWILPFHSTGSSVSAGPSSPSSIRDSVQSLFPWLVIFLVIWFVLFRSLRGKGRRLWESNPALQQPQTVDVDEQGIRLTSILSVTQWQWASFVGAGETKNLIYLEVPGKIFLCIPKRAASTPAELDELRRIFRERATGSRGAFPVLPAGASASNR